MSGYNVEALDGDIGTVNEATLDAGASYLVIDTSHRIGKKVAVPAGLIDRVDRDKKKVYVGRTKDEIWNAPEFDSGYYRQRSYLEKLGVYYAATPLRPLKPPAA